MNDPIKVSLAVTSFGILAGAIVFMIHNFIAERSGDWCPRTSFWSGDYLMRRYVNGKWETRTPTKDEIEEYFGGGHPI